MNVESEIIEIASSDDCEVFTDSPSGASTNNYDSTSSTTATSVSSVLQRLKSTIATPAKVFFSILNNTFKSQQQQQCLQDLFETSVMLQYNRLLIILVE